MSVRSSMAALAMLAVSIPIAFIAATATPSTAEPAKPPCASTAADQPTADAMARRCGTRVEDVSSRTEAAQRFRNTDGSSTLEVSVQPKRIKRTDGSWVAIDTRLQKVADGWAPVASTVDVVFSGGGTGPLVTVTKVGRTFALGWPEALPVPVVSGDTATYTQVLPGADLLVTATATGFTHVLAVRDSAAAANPALRRIVYTLGGSKVKISTLEQGGVNVDGDDGTPLLRSGAAVMWDSSRTAGLPSGASAAANSIDSEPSTARGPGDQAQRATAAITVQDGQLVLEPDPAMLSVAQFPLYIDPAFTSPTPSRWAYSNSTNENNDTSTVRMGKNPSGGAVYRPLFEFPVSALIGSRIISATFAIQLYHSYSCGPTAATLWRANGIASSPKNPWGNSGVNTYLATTSAAANKDDCYTSAQPTMSFGNNLAADLQAVANSSWSTYTVALSAMDSAGNGESTTDRWKKFNVGTAVLSVNYNHAPGQPALTDLSIDPSTPCGASAPYVNTEQGLTLRAKLSDPNNDNVKAQWQVTGIPAQYAPADSGLAAAGDFTTTIPAAAFTDGASYSWSVRGSDNADAGAYSPSCPFKVDNTLPGNPTAASTDLALGTGLLVPPAAAGAVVGRPAKVNLTRAAADTNIAGYLIGVGVGAPAGAALWIPADTNGTATAAIVPSASGSNINYLSVIARDLAGQSSATVVYKFKANTATGINYVAGDATGDGRADVTVLSDAGSGNSALWRFDAAGDTSALLPPVAPQSPETVYSTAGTRAATGDFDHDGRSDVAMLRQSGGNVELTVQQSNGNAALGTGALQSMAGWSVANIKLVAGDVNGDGMADLIANYVTSSTSWEMRVLLATGVPGTIAFAAPVNWLTNTSSEFTRIAFTAGDFNSDGKTDVAEFYDRGGEQTGIFMHYSTGSAFPFGTLQWDSGAGNFGWSHGKYVAGDFTGDGRSDVAVLYDYSNAQVSLLVFPASSTGALSGGWQSWWPSGTAWRWNFGATEPVTGDINADGRSDVSLVYHCCGAYQARVWSLQANAAGTSFSAPVTHWSGALGPLGAGAVPADNPTRKYYLVDTNSGKCITVPGGAIAENVQLQIQPCSPTNLAGQVTLTVSGGGQYLVAFAHTADRCIGVAGGPVGNAYPVSQTSCGYGWNPMMLNFESGGISGNDATVSIRPMYDGYVLDVTGFGTTDGSPIQQYQWANGPNQKFTLRPVS